MLGHVMRNGRGIRQLLLYRHAVDLGAEDPTEVDVMAYLEGTVQDVRCDICGATRKWTMGIEEVEKVMQKYLAE